MHSEPSTQNGVGFSHADAVAAQALSDHKTSLPALRFDPEEFMHFVRHENLSDEQARELLEEIWKIVVAFVDLGFNLSPIQQALDNSGTAENAVAPDSPQVVS